jgi:hypothetical protein
MFTPVYYMPLGLPSGTEKAKGFPAYIEDNRLAGTSNSLLTLDKFSGLNVSVESERGVMNAIMRAATNTKSSKSKSSGYSVLSYTVSVISTPLLRSLLESSRKTDTDSIYSSGIRFSTGEISRLFLGLQIVMGTKPISSLASSKVYHGYLLMHGQMDSHKVMGNPHDRALYCCLTVIVDQVNNRWSILIGNYDNEVDIAMELILLGQKQLKLSDELYLQLCKQLHFNPDPQTTKMGWILMSLYLHYFPPSAQLLPHLENFVSYAMRNGPYVGVDSRPSSPTNVPSSPTAEGKTTSTIKLLIYTCILFVKWVLHSLLIRFLFFRIRDDFE